MAWLAGRPGRARDALRVAAPGVRQRFL